MYPGERRYTLRRGTAHSPWYTGWDIPGTSLLLLSGVYASSLPLLSVLSLAESSLSSYDTSEGDFIPDLIPV